MGMVYNYLPYMIMPLYTVIAKLDPRLIEAAQDLGCDNVQTFRRVVLPLSLPGIVSGITMVFVPAVSTFYISQKLGGTDNIMIGDIIERQFKGIAQPEPRRGHEPHTHGPGVHLHRPHEPLHGRRGGGHDMKRLGKVWTFIVYLFLYAPMIVLFVGSFNDGKDL